MTEHIKTLDYLIGETHVKAHRDALVAARNRLEADMRHFYAGIRKPEDWPYCAQCGKAFSAQPTSALYVREVQPVCKCQASVVWQGRPVGNDWEYFIEAADIVEAGTSWERYLNT